MNRTREDVPGVPRPAWVRVPMRSRERADDSLNMATRTDTLAPALPSGRVAADVLRGVGRAAGQALDVPVQSSAELRRALASSGLLCDLLAALVSYEVAVLFFAFWRHGMLGLGGVADDWGVAAALVAIVAVFAFSGLYRLEAWASRPLHLLLLVKATTVALVVTAFLTFVFKTSLLGDSRLTIFAAFALFFVLASVLRLVLLDRVYRNDVRRRRGATVVVGWSSDEGVHLSRLKELRGFAQVRTLQPTDRRRNGYDAEPALLEVIASAEPAPRQVFLDGASLGHKAALDLVTAAGRRGIDVYVTGRLVGPLDSTGLLMRLFEVPVAHVKHSPGAPRSRASRVALRVFDSVAAHVIVLLLLPVYGAIALAVKLDSRGPVIYRQKRVGRDGQVFDFLKFRSMRVANDASTHTAVVRSFIAGELDPELDRQDEWGRPVLKMADDERVTRVGRFIRKYSLDELPQLWNVLRGDMRLIGPRPALPYEVDVYKQWHRARLAVAPGVSGLWQVAGRSRVEFDDMVFQDVMYGYNQSVLTDVHLCLRTLPAVLTGSGAA